MPVPGVGPVTAPAGVATVGDARTFRNGRQFAAWLGVVPRHHASGGTRRLSRVTKRSDVDLRTWLIHGARALMGQRARRTDATSRWVTALQACILWALLATGRLYQPAAQAPEAKYQTVGVADGVSA